MMKNSAYLLVDASGPEIQYRSGITAPDPFMYLAPDDGTPTVYFDAREYAVQKAKLDQLNNGVGIEYLEPYLSSSADGQDPLVAALLNILKELRITHLYISAAMPFGIARQLEQAGFDLSVYQFDRERERKSEQEIQHMVAAQRITEGAFSLVWELLAQSEIDGDFIKLDGEILTSEKVKLEVKKYLLEHQYGCPDGIIVASGEQTARPHDEGEGPLRANQLIIIDIFPRSEITGYVADMTRTFVKGKPTPKARELLEIVDKVQSQVLDHISVGDACSAVHRVTVDTFIKLGHKVSHKEGFMHGTGHSLGLAVHENPRLNAQSDRIIEPGMIFTVEPGLYYPGVGGVRIEDVVVFHPDGRKENITRFDKPYVIA